MSLTGSGQAQVITGPGPGGGPHVRTFDVTPGGDATSDKSFLSNQPDFTGGVEVAGLPEGQQSAGNQAP